jgi:hypothetical protein
MKGPNPRLLEGSVELRYQIKESHEKGDELRFQVKEKGAWTKAGDD